MTDQRIEEFAEVLVDRAAKVEKGDNVYLSAYSTEVLPLFDEVRRQVIEKGAFPHEHLIYDSQLGRAGLDYDWLKYGSEEQLKTVSEAKKKELEEMDVYISIGGRDNERELNGVEPEKISLRKRETKILSEMRSKLRWVLTRYPTDSLAQNAGMPTPEFEDFVFSSVVDVDWDELEERNQEIKQVFDEADEVRIVSEGTDLTMSLENRDGIAANGNHNIPDGEVFYAPRRESLEGHIEFTYPGVKQGNEVRGVRLEFEDGKVVDYSAETNEDYLREQLETDEGSKYIGELGIGTNRQIDRFVNEIGFDEKIGGTIHLALGKAFDECVGEDEEKNDSAIHWDIVKDLRKPEGDGGKIIVDGEVVQKDGEWVF
ncbi:MAG: aminopeptidase [Candidatus Nanohaloarchaea archaeon]